MSDRPRFRVMFPTNENMPPDVYRLIQGCLADKLEDAGYKVDRGGKGMNGTSLSNTRPSGLDWGKGHPISLFYLPCQAQHAGASFFHDHQDDGLARDRMFFDLALSLRRAGMNLQEIEMTLRGEAHGPMMGKRTTKKGL